MNQTQTRSLRKKVLSLILAVVMVVSLLPISAFASGDSKASTTASTDEFVRIFHLDCGRKYFSVSEIEGIIDQLAENHYTHLQLAFGNDGLRFLLNDMSVEANGTTYDSDEVTSAIQYGNQQYYNAGSKNELTQSDMNTIIDYAKGKGISIIPMFNAPYHVNALLTAMESKLNITDARKTFAIKGDDGKITYKDTYLNLASQDAVAFVKALQAKYVAYFAGKGSTYFNFGADEYYFKGLDNALYTKFATFVNDLAGIVKNKKMIPMAYNDGFYFNGLTLQDNVEFDTDIRICYWAEDGGRASAETLAGKGFKIINNSNDWYYVLGDYLYEAWGSGQWGYESALNGLKTTNVLQVKGDSSGAVTPIGSVLCCWCDGPSKSWSQNKDKVYDLIKVMAENNPDYFKDTTPVLAPADGGTVSAVKQADGSYNVAVAANDTVQLKLTNVADPVLWSSSDEAVATVNNGLVTFTGKTGTVKITAQPQSAANDGEMTPYTVSFNVTEKGAPIPVTVAVGRTVKETLQGDQTTISGDYSEFVDVKAEHKTTTAGAKLQEITSADDLVSGEQYLIANQRHGGLLTGVASNDWRSQYVGLKLSGEASSDNNTDLWTITQSGSAYTVQYKGSNYLTVGESVATAGGSNTSKISLAYNSTGYWTISQNGYYLNHLGKSNTAGGWDENGAATDEGSRWTIYRIVEEEATDTTTVSFTGKKVGDPVLVTVGDTTYSVTVVEKQNVEIPISIIDYRADGLLFDWTYSSGSNSYRYGFVHGQSGSSRSVAATKDSTTGLYTVDGNNSSVEQIAGTKIEQTGPANSVYGQTFYTGSLDNSWSRAGLVQKELGSNGMPVYTDAAVKYVASLLKAGYYNEMSGNCNSLIYDTFVASNGSRSIRKTSADDFSESFKNAKTYANITNAYDLAWYLLNTIYQADTNMTTVTGSDGQTHSVPIYGMAVDTYKSIILTPNEDGTTYSFEAGYRVKDSSGNVTFDYPAHIKYDQTGGTICEDASEETSYAFYPLDGLGYEQSGLLTKTSAIDSTHNGSFTLRGESQFVYNSSSNLYFTFTGDDDVYMYINGKLALDLGGAHGRNTKTVKLNDLDPTEYGLVDGQVATFTFFYMERCSDASTFGIKTNMELVKPGISVAKKAYSDVGCTNPLESGWAVETGKSAYYDLIVTNQNNVAMNHISFADTDSRGGMANFGYDVANASVSTGTENTNGTVSLKESGSYVIYVTDANETEVSGTRKTPESLSELSTAVADVTLEPGQSLHVRFLQAEFKVDNAKILNYENTVNVTATVGNQNLSKSATHELYSYNAGDTSRTYVVDFGLPLKIEGIFDSGVKDNVEAVGLSSTNVLKYGEITTFTPNGYDTSLVYTRAADKTINDAETIVLDVTYLMGSNKVTLQKTLTIIPATTVYYEDSLATFTNANKSTGVNKGTGNGYWVTDGITQTSVNQALEELGGTTNTKHVYGYDPAYAGSSKFSMGSATKVTVDANTANNGQWPTATFTFKGTGFDVISLTDNNSGAISVKVYSVGSDGTKTQVKGTLVNNYYGYTYADGKWEAAPTDKNNALYQVPVIKISDLPYGTYEVVITVSYATFADKTNDHQYSFWLDAIRVYDPAGKTLDTEYEQDNEKAPNYVEVKKVILDSKALETAGATGAVFIDGKGANGVTAADYKNQGPNHEAYLADGQAIAFQLIASAEPTSVQIGAKLASGNSAGLQIGGAACAKASNGTLTLNTATDMYYALTDMGWTLQNDGTYRSKVITLTNAGSGIISLTNLKFIGAKYTGSLAEVKSATSETNLVTLAVSSEMIDEALTAVDGALNPAPETFEPSHFEADWNRSVRAGQKATLTVKTSEDVDAITVDGQTITTYRTRTERTGWGWWSPRVTYRVFTYTTTAQATADYEVCALNSDSVASEPITATLTVKPAINWWHKWF